MGKSDPYILSFYRSFIDPAGDTALLGFTNNSWFTGDLYDKSLENWDINSQWELSKKYDTIVCTRCAYFAKDPEDFITRCYNNLNENGTLFVDWGLGDHWRFENYKIGWVKDGEQEYAYGKDNYLWSTIWDDSFEKEKIFQLFAERVKKFGYENIKESIFEEVPTILNLKFVEKKFKIAYNLITLWEDYPQLYILIKGKKI